MSISSADPMLGRAPAATGWLAPLSVFAGALLLYCVNLDDGLTVHDELHHILAGRGPLETGEPRIAALRGWQQRFDQCELRVGEIGCVATARTLILMASGSTPHRP